MSLLGFPVPQCLSPTRNDSLTVKMQTKILGIPGLRKWHKNYLKVSFQWLKVSQKENWHLYLASSKQNQYKRIISSHSLIKCPLYNKGPSFYPKLWITVQVLIWGNMVYTLSWQKKIYVSRAIFFLDQEIFRIMHYLSLNIWNHSFILQYPVLLLDMLWTLDSDWKKN